MAGKLQAIRELQDIELQIVDIRKQLLRKEKLVAAQTRRLDELRNRLKTHHDETRRAQAAFDELDLEVKARSGNIAKLREQLNTVRTNKEYAAVLTQMNTEKADLSKLETRALELMAGVETKKSESGELKNTEQTEVGRLNELQLDLDQTRQTLADRVNRLQSERKQRAALLSDEDLSHFDRLSERYDGEVMAEVLQPNPRRDEFVCGGCNLSLRTEVGNALKIRDDVITCRSCGRILWLRVSN